MNTPNCLSYFLSAVAVCAFVLHSAHAEPVDPMVENAPTFECRIGNEGHVLRRIELSGVSGPLSLTGGKIIAATETRWITPSAGRSPTNSGAIACLDEDGKLLWQAVHPRLEKRIHDLWQPIRSTPCIEEGRAYYVSNRGELVCVDVEGFRDGVNNGPFESEDGIGTTDADYLWKLDMIGECSGARPATWGIRPLLQSCWANWSIVLPGMDERAPWSFPTPRIAEMVKM